MGKKMTAVVLLVTMVFLASVGCRKAGTATGGKKQSSATPQGGTATEQPPPAGRTQPPAAVGDANQPPAGGVTETSANISAQRQIQTYLQDSEKTITDLRQKMSTLLAQIGALKAESKPKAQQLQQQFQQDLANALAALSKTKTASGAAWTEAKEAADKALSSAASTLKELESYLQSQQGTK